MTDRGVPARDFAAGVEAVVAILDELASYHDVGKAEWVVTAARFGSMSMTIHAPGSEVAEQGLLNGVVALSQRRRPEAWSARALRMISKVPCRRGKPALHVAAARGRRGTAIDSTVRATAAEFAKVAPAMEYFGSVIGRLDRPEQLQSHRAIVEDRMTGRRIEVGYDPAHLESVRRLWGKLVEISGVITPTATGEPRNIQATAFDPIGDAVPFSTIFGLLADDESFDPVTYLEGVRG